MRRNKQPCFLWLVGCGVLVAMCAEVIWGQEADASDEVTAAPVFESDVVPILKAYCWRCHGGEGREAVLDLRSVPLLLEGGKSGAVIVRGKAEKSLLFKRMAKGEMPPGEALKPTKEHIETVRAWLEAGAPARYEGNDAAGGGPEWSDEQRGWWAFRKPVRPAVPRVQAQERVRTAIDAFLLRKLEEHGLGFAADADRVTLVRRVYLDLIGLPPSPQEVDAFLAGEGPGSYERLVDRLLASQHYGERWGRHWLDAAGYVDTIGSDNDASIIEQREGVWKYRDYVVRSFNEDKPYDRFLLEQIAGDELVDWRGAEHYTPQIEEMLVATGFLRQASDVTYAPELNTADIRHQVLYDTIQILTTNVLGLTVQCARCHDHKFDPIAQREYYQLAALLTPSYDVQHWKHSKERILWDVSAADKGQIDAHNAEIDRQAGELNGQIAALRRPFEQKLFAKKLEAIPEVIRSDTKAAVGTAADKRSEVQKYLAEKLGPLLQVTPEEVQGALDEEARGKQAELQQQIAKLQAAKQTYGKIQATWEVGAVPPTYLYRRGDFATPGPRVTPGVPAMLDDPRAAFRLPEARKGVASSGYRTALARWLTRPDHPLTARVVVNRVWQQYFGTGLVATPDNFGRSGAAPTHPELLDWLATEFVREGWSFKKLHRLIVTSTAYRQASHQSRERQRAGVDSDFITDPILAAVSSATGSAPRPAIQPTARAQTVDPENRLLWHMPLRRLESEIIRDSMLSVSGALDTRQGGPPIPLKPNPDGSVEIDTAKLRRPSDRFRRSLYVLARRNYQLSELNLFDQPIVAENCTRRTSSAVVLQSLALLNSAFAFEQAERFAARVRELAGADETARIRCAFRLALAREPANEELALSRQLLDGQRARYTEQSAQAQAAADRALVDLCQMLFNTNEFLYVL